MLIVHLLIVLFVIIFFVMHLVYFKIVNIKESISFSFHFIVLEYLSCFQEVVFEFNCS